MGTRKREGPPDPVCRRLALASSHGGTSSVTRGRNENALVMPGRHAPPSGHPALGYENPHVGTQPRATGVLGFPGQRMPTGVGGEFKSRTRQGKQEAGIRPGPPFRFLPQESPSGPAPVTCHRARRADGRADARGGGSLLSGGPGRVGTARAGHALSTANRGETRARAPTSRFLFSSSAAGRAPGGHLQVGPVPLPLGFSRRAGVRTHRE